MRVLALEDVRRFALRDAPRPEPRPNEVLLRVLAVGVCGTDFHIYDGSVNYHFDNFRRPVPLALHPLVLGHEFCGRVVGVGEGVSGFALGEMVIVDQLLNCFSQNRQRPCEYCLSGDSHQCEFGQEMGITGPPGAFADYVAVPAVNVIKVPPGVSSLEAALAEPLACVAHSIERLERAGTRYSFAGTRNIRTVLVLGAGPSGLLFVQFLRHVIRFDGDILVADSRDARLALARDFGGSPVDIRSEDVVERVERNPGGAGVECIIEASGSSRAIDSIPKVARRQASVLLYGSGHAGLSDGCLTPFQTAELHVVTSAGASGGFDDNGTPSAYRNALDHIAAKRINVSRLVSHRYSQLSELPEAFITGAKAVDYIKGALVRDEQA
jgi:L-iditol 2-dehydrogenase